MADEQNVQDVPPLPPTGTIVTPAALYNTQITMYQNTLAFGGQRNPTNIWSSMVRNDAWSIPYYRELEEKDTDVANALDTLKLSVLKREQRVTPFDDSGLAQDVADFVTAQIAGLPDFHEVLSNILDAPGYGFSVGEMIFDTSEGQASLVDILDCPQELFLFGERFQPQIGPLQFMDQPQASSGTLVPEQKFVVFSYKPRGRNRMGRPLLRSVFWSSWFKRNMQRLWLRYAEKGPGTVVVEYDDAADASQKQLAAQVAQMISESTAVGVPSGLRVVEELLKGTRTIDVATYEHSVESWQLDIVRRILGETLTSFGAEKGKGTQALGTVHSETLDDKSVELAKAVAGVFNRQVVRPLVLWNYGPNAPMPKWGLDVDEEKDLTERLAIDKGVQSMGAPITVSYLQSTYGLPAPQPDDVIAQPNAAAVAAPAPAVSASFSEETGRELQEQQLAQFDRLTEQLSKTAEKLLQQRVVEVADALRPKVS